MWKALSVIAAILAAGAAFLSYLNKGDLAQERELLVTSEQNLKSIGARAKEVTAAQEAAVRRIAAMESRRDGALEAQETEKQKLSAKEAEIEETNQRIKELETEIAAADAQIAEFGNAEQLVTLIDQLQSDLFTAKNQIAALDGRLNSTTSRAQQTAKRIQSYKDLESRQRNGEMLSTSARISSVYNDWGYAILNQGDRQGIVSRAKFDVMRGNEAIAQLVVTALEPNSSVCDIVPGSMEPGDVIRPGDRLSVAADSLPKPKAEVDPNAPVASAPAAAGGGAAAMPAAGAEADAPAMEEMTPGGVPAGEDDPFGDLDAPSTPEAPPAADDPAPAEDDPFGDL